MSGALAAVDVQDFPGDERRVLQVHDRVDDVVDLTDSAEEGEGPRGPHVSPAGAWECE